MATVTGGVGYGLYFIAKVHLDKDARSKLGPANLILALHLSSHRATYPTAT
jgi:hypothetical protein